MNRTDRKHRLWAILGCVAMLATSLGCAGEDEGDALAPGDEAAPNDATPGDDPASAVSTPGFIEALAPPTDYAEVDGTRTNVGATELTPSPDESSRALRRMSVDQLRQAISRATGGISWRDEAGNDMFELLAPTLGVPDYIDTTGEDLESSLVFQKFLGDGVRVVCDETIGVDLEAAPGDRVLIRHVDPTLRWEDADEAGQQAIERNLTYMKLRITGHGPSSDIEEMDRLRWLFRSVTHATNDPARGWRAVCVGLMASPEFYLY